MKMIRDIDSIRTRKALIEDEIYKIVNNFLDENNLLLKEIDCEIGDGIELEKGLNSFRLVIEL